MPFALVIIGLIVVVAAVRDQLSTLSNLVIGDFTGSGNFIYFFVAIIVLGSIGYIEKLKPVSDAFLILVIVVLFLHNRGVFSQFQSALGTATAPKLNTGGLDLTNPFANLSPLGLSGR